MTTFDDLKQLAISKVQNLDIKYKERLDFELSEIIKQGAEANWLGYYTKGVKFKSHFKDGTPNRLVLPWLIGMVDLDPLSVRTDPILNTVRASKVLEYRDVNGIIPNDFIKDPDSPDIDIDCLPDARDPIKQYAIDRYGKNFDDGYGSVCSVGTWATFKFSSALIGAAVAMGVMNRYEMEAYTTQLPDEADELKDGGKASCKGKVLKDVKGVIEEVECGFMHRELVCPQCKSADTDGPTFAKLLSEHSVLQDLYNKHKDVVETAIDLIGRISNMGMHAGALIITDRPLYGNIPLARASNKGFWVSMWTEGRNAQLSKFGYIKWDILGLKTLAYIFNCCKMIEKNRGISFGDNLSGWDDINPLGTFATGGRRAGHYFDHNGVKHYINIDDEKVIDYANRQLTDGVFQFDTDLAKSILANGVRCFEDLLLFNAMGHPGPMQCCWSHSKIDIDSGSGSGSKTITELDPLTDAIKCAAVNGEVVFTNKYKIMKSGPKRLFKIKLKDGRQIIVSPDHRVGTDRGYVNAGELTTGQYVAVCDGGDVKT